MEKAHLEEMNGTVVIALPPAILERLHLVAGSEVELALENETLLVSRSLRPRYRLADLIAISDPLAFERTDEDHEWLNSPPVGRERI